MTSEKSDVPAVIRAYLASRGGTAAAGDVVTHAAEHGASPATVHRAAARAGIVKTRQGSRTFLWSLPDAADLEPNDDTSARDAEPDMSASDADEHDHADRVDAATFPARRDGVAAADRHDVDGMTVKDRRAWRERAADLHIDLTDWPADQHYPDVGLTDDELQALVEDAEHPADDPTPTSAQPRPAARHRPSHY